MEGGRLRSPHIRNARWIFVFAGAVCALLAKTPIVIQNRSEGSATSPGAGVPPAIDDDQPLRLTPEKRRPHRAPIRCTAAGPPRLKVSIDPTQSFRL